MRAEQRKKSASSSSRAQRRPWPFRIVLVVLAGLAGSLIAPAAAEAHTGFQSSTPGDGQIVDAPVSIVTIAFTNPATPVGDEFTALDPSGQLRTPSDVTTDDGRTFVLTFEPPLAGGQIGVRWSVQAPDAHPIDGSFAFTVTASVPTTLPAAAPAAEPDTGADVAAAVEEPLSSTEPSPTLDEFLATDTSRPGETASLLGRIVGLLGVAFVIGGMAFMATTLRGSRREIDVGVTVLRVLGLAVAGGALLELVGLHQAGDLSAGALLESPGLSMLLRLVGGLAVAAGLVPATRSSRRVRALSAAALETPGAAVVDASDASWSTGESDLERSVRWDPRSSATALFGVAAILASSWFAGHTVSKGPRLVHALLNSIHVAAGSVWAGGVVSMAAVAWWRYRRGRPARAAELVVRFSSVATVALIAVGAAGMVMAVFVLDSIGELTGTEWGRILLLKTAFVALAAGGGAYNHFRLLPALEADPDDEELAAELRSTVTAEAIVLAFVVVVTAWLVAAAS